MSKNRSKKGTTVANGYHADIMVCVNGSQVYKPMSGWKGSMNAMSMDAGPSVKVDFDNRRTRDFRLCEQGLTTIKPGSYHNFPIHGFDGNVHVTMKIGHRTPYDNTPFRNNTNLVVTRQGEIKECSNSIWTDRTGFIHAPRDTKDCPEWLTNLVITMKDEGLEDDIKEAFRDLDQNGDGYITAAELKAAFKSTGLSLSTREAKELIGLVDEDGDGVIDYNEFCLLYRQYFCD